MDALAAHLRTQAYNNAWANHRLLGACAQLAAADFDAPRVGFFPSIARTLNHILAVDRFYLDAIERSLGGHAVNADARDFFAPKRALATCAAIRAEQAAADRRLVALCDALDTATLRLDIAVSRAAGIAIEPLPRLLAHLFQHQVHHRGQVHAMLSGTTVAPPPLDDFFCAGDAPLRAADFAALGFDEAAIWPGGR